MFTLNRENGFTTVELIVAIAIAGILMGAVGSFLSFNIKSYNATKRVIDIQYEGQVGINQLSTIAMKSSGIDEIIDVSSGLSRLNTTQIATDDLDTISFKYYEDIGLADDKETLYTITYDQTTDPDNKKLMVRIDVDDDGDATVDNFTLDSSYVMMEHIGSLKISPMSSDGSLTFYSDAFGMLVELEMVYGEASYELQTEMKFRNKH